MLQTILTPLCISLVVCGLLFFYFKNRLSSTETKVDLMFQLIQEHENQRQLTAQNFVQMPPGTPQQNYEATDMRGGEPSPLIDVSDSEDSDSDDSDSDSESGRLILEENIEDNDAIKKVMLSISGAEIGDKASPLEVSEPEQLDSGSLDKTEIKEINIAESHAIEAEALDDINLSADEDDAASDDDEEDEEDDDETDDQIDNTTTSVKKLPTDKPLDKWKVRELKSECKRRGLDGYKSLKKNAIIDLLNTASAKQTTTN